MSSENVEVARTLIEAFNAGDWGRYFDLLDPDIAWWDREDDPGATVHRGHQGIRDYLAEVAEATEFRAHAEELVAEGDSVIVCLRFNGRGVASGAEFEQREVHVLRLR